MVIISNRGATVTSLLVLSVILALTNLISLSFSSYLLKFAVSFRTRICQIIKTHHVQSCRSKTTFNRIVIILPFMVTIICIIDYLQ